MLGSRPVASIHQAARLRTFPARSSQRVGQGRPAILIRDGLGAHKSRATTAYLDSPRNWLRVERLPAYSPDLNPVEALWGNITENVTAQSRGQHPVHPRRIGFQPVRTPFEYRPRQAEACPWSFYISGAGGCGYCLGGAALLCCGRALARLAGSWPQTGEESLRILVSPAVTTQQWLGPLKGFTAHQANRILGRHGPFWQDQSYAHLIRDDREFQRVQRYIEQNPVRAGLVALAEEFAWSSAAPGRSPAAG